MPGFSKGPGLRSPFGVTTFLRSTQDVKTESYTLAEQSVPWETVDGVPQKRMKKGEVLAKITSGPDIGKVGPYQGGGAPGTNEVQTLTKTGTWSAGTYTLTVLGQTTAALAYNATAADVQTAVRAAVAASTDGSIADQADGIVITGGPLSTTPLVVTFNGEGGDVTAITWDITLVTGTTPGLGVAETTAGVTGATDGRATAANIVGINNTELPWQLMERDVEVAAVYECTAYLDRCTERNAAGQRITLTNTTADAMRNTRGLDCMFK